MAGTIKIKNWHKFQHFKDRRPPWVKLHREIMDQRDINSISDCSFRVLVNLWLLASEDETLEGIIPPIDDIAFRIRMDKNKIIKSLEELKPFLIQDDIAVISEEHQFDVPETETETETETEIKSAKKFTDEDLLTANFIFEKIQQLNPEHKDPNFESWASDIRLMRERDGRSHEEIKTMFEWANDDDFWKTNILSPSKLRKQWDKLVIKKNDEANNANSNGSGKRFQTGADILAEGCSGAFDP